MLSNFKRHLLALVKKNTKTPLRGTNVFGYSRLLLKSFMFIAVNLPYHKQPMQA